jgi:hypothetical protein
MRQLGRRSWHWILSPGFFLAGAVVFTLAFAVVALAGWREHTTFLSGTAITVQSEYASSVLRGLLYLLAYFCAVLIAPILVLGAGILALLCRRTKSPDVVG